MESLHFESGIYAAPFMRRTPPQWNEAAGKDEPQVSVTFRELLGGEKGPNSRCAVRESTSLG